MNAFIVSTVRLAAKSACGVFPDTTAVVHDVARVRVDIGKRFENHCFCPGLTVALTAV
jgi:hypothetical protein